MCSHLSCNFNCIVCFIAAFSVINLSVWTTCFCTICWKDQAIWNWLVARVSSCPGWTSWHELTPRYPCYILVVRSTWGGVNMLHGRVKCGVVSGGFSQRLNKWRGRWLHTISSSSSLLQPLSFLSIGLTVSQLCHQSCFHSSRPQRSIETIASFDQWSGTIENHWKRW